MICLLSRAGYSLSVILRRAIDTPRPDEDIVTARDRWISTLTD